MKLGCVPNRSTRHSKCLKPPPNLPPLCSPYSPCPGISDALMKSTVEFSLLVSNPSRQVWPDGDTGSQEQWLASILHPFQFRLQMLNNRKQLAARLGHYGLQLQKAAPKRQPFIRRRQVQAYLQPHTVGSDALHTQLNGSK